MKYKIPSLKIIHPENPSRENFLELLPTAGVIAEIGVHAGGHARSMREICQPKEFVLVDCWELTGGDRYSDTGCALDDSEIVQKRNEVINSRYNSVLKEFSDCTVIKGWSDDVSEEFSDSYFDAIYIDSSHTLEDTFCDMKHWFPKVKIGGIICGHDFEFSSSKKLSDPTDEISSSEMWITPVSGNFGIGEQATNTAHVNGDVITAVFSFAQQNQLAVEIYYQSSRFHESTCRPIESYEWLIKK